MSEQQRGSPLRRLVTTGGLAGTPWHEPEGSTDAELKLAGFHVGDGLYGIDIMRIKEVIQSRPYPIRAVPHAPALVEGVIQLRGVVIPVVDLRKRFGAPTPTGNEKLEKLIIVSVRGRIVGLKVDRIVGELRVPAGGLRPAPSMLRPSGHSGPEFFTGVCRVAEGMVFVVNLEALIDPRVIPPPADSSGSDDKNAPPPGDQE